MRIVGVRIPVAQAKEIASFALYNERFISLCPISRSSMRLEYKALGIFFLFAKSGSAIKPAYLHNRYRTKKRIRVSGEFSSVPMFTGKINA